MVIEYIDHRLKPRDTADCTRRMAPALFCSIEPAGEWEKGRRERKQERYKERKKKTERMRETETLNDTHACARTLAFTVPYTGTDVVGKICMYIQTLTYICIMYVHIYIYKYTCICMYARTHAHTHAPTHSHLLRHERSCRYVYELDKNTDS